LSEPTLDELSLSVLVIEDNVDAAESLRLLLEFAGHTAVVAFTGVEGVAAARSAPPDVIVSDIGLPGLDGFAVARTLRADPATARVRLIAVTGYGRDEDRRKSREAGFDLHFVKPVDPEELLANLAPGGRAR
jgi:CheY-like chemotaxis protein